MTDNRLSKLIKDVFSSPDNPAITLNIIRHIYVSHFTTKLSKKEIQTASNMCHSLSTNQSYIKED